MNSAMQELGNYVIEHARRGTCRCGVCCDHPGVDTQPEGHTADVIFFEVSNEGGEAGELLRLLEAAKQGEFCDCDPLDGLYHNYMELGGWIGDQGMALMLMGLGAVLGIWNLLTPKTIGCPEDQVMNMAANGFLFIIKAKKQEAVA